MPTREWKAATNSGIDVIGTRRAISVPILPPTTIPPTTSPQAVGLAGGGDPRVVSTAMAMPSMPNRLPRRLGSGLDRPRSARMNRTPRASKSSAKSLGFMSRQFFFLLEHRQHALGDENPAENIHRSKGQSDEAKCARPQWTVIICDQRNTNRQQCADHDH